LGVNAPLDLPASPTERAEWASDGYLIRLLTGELRGRPLCATFAANTTDPADRQVFFRWAAPRYHLLPLGVDIRFHPRSRKVDLAQVLEDNRQRWETTALPDLSRAETAQELNPDYVRSHYATSLTNFGYLCEVAKQPQAAEAIYRRVVDWAPDHRPAVESLAALRKKQAAPPGGTP